MYIELGLTGNNLFYLCLHFSYSSVCSFHLQMYCNFRNWSFELLQGAFGHL